MGRTIVVVVDERRCSDAAFWRALAETKAEDALLIVFPRPPRTGGHHWETTMQPVNDLCDARSAEILQKYSQLAAIAQVSFAAMEVESFHADAAIAKKCEEVGAAMLVRGVRRPWPLSLPRAAPCPRCNPFLRPSGQAAALPPCDLRRRDVTRRTWAVVEVKAESRRRSQVTSSSPR